MELSESSGEQPVIVEKIVFSEQDIKNKVERLGKQITEDFWGKELLVIGVLRGAFIFMADLIREIKLDIAVDFMLVSSYENSKESSGIVRIVKDAKENIYHRHVLIVEDIIDTGLTYYNLKKTLETRDPASLSICTLLSKDRPRTVEVPIDYYGFEAPDEFLVGYGLDYQENYRHCKYIFKPTKMALEEIE